MYITIKMVYIKNEIGFKYAINLPKVVIIFGSITCEACKKVIKIFLPILKQNYENISFIFVDGDKFPTLADEYNIEYYPTFIYFENSKIKRRTGATNIKDIDKDLFQ
jgi:thiol-disulfide isomerase/thioredoxin